MENKNINENTQISMRDRIREILKDLLDKSDRQWSNSEHTLWIVKKDKFFYIAIIHFDIKIFKYKKRNKKWIWVSMIDSWKRERMANDKEIKYFAKTAMGIRHHLKTVEDL